MMQPVVQYNKAPSGKGIHPAPGEYSYNPKNSYVTLRPFWVSPINVLPHSIHIASKLHLSDSNNLHINVFGFLGLLTLSSYQPSATYSFLGACGALWFLWALDFPRGTRKLLTSPEIWNNIN
jgi:hypothetical protein